MFALQIKRAALRKYSVLSVIGLLLLFSLFVSSSAFAPFSKFDWLDFREDLYVGDKCEIRECRMCFDYDIKEKVKDADSILNTHIKDLSKTEDRSSDVYNLKVKSYELANVTEDVKVVVERSVSKSYDCFYSLDVTDDYAKCYEDTVNGTDVKFEHSYASLIGKTISWDELQNFTEDGKAIREEWIMQDIGKDKLSEEVKAKDSSDKGTFCIVGKVNPGTKVDVFPEIFGYEYPEYATWNSSGWRYRVNITIQQTNVTYRKNNWVAPIDITLPGLRNASSADSIAFVDNASRQLAHDIEYFNNSINATHGRVVAWIKHFDWHNESDYAIQMWWNTSDPQNQENISGVWNDTSTSIRYQFVSHLGGNSTHAISDESGFKYSTQCYNAANCPSFNTTTGLIGNSLYFDGSNGVWASGLNGTSLFGDAFWFSTWVHLNTGPSTIQYWAEAGKNADIFVSQYKPNAGNMRLHVQNNPASNTVDASDSATVKDRWVLMTGNVDTNGQIQSFYENNTLLGSGTGNSPDVSGVINTTFGFATLSTGGAPSYMTGLLDEVQIGSGAVTASDVQDRFEIEINASNYFTMNATEDVNPPAPPPPSAVSAPQVNVSLTNQTSSNASATTKSQQLFGYANYSNTVIGTLEVNSTFKWFINNTNQSWGGGNRTTEMVPLIYKDAVGYWHLDENGGTSGYVDSSGQGNTGTPVSGVANGTGIINGALLLDGVNDYVNLNIPQSLNITNFTVSAWIYRNGTGGRDEIVSRDNAGGLPRSFDFGIQSDKLAIDMWNSSNVLRRHLETSESLRARTWYHVAFTYDKATLGLYINGTLATSSYAAATEQNLMGMGGKAVEIGRAANGRFNGSIDEVAIYNRSLSANEVKQLYLRTWYDYSPEVLLAHMDNSSGGLVNATDMGSRQQAATLMGGVNCTSAVTGYYGQACKFDGVNDYVNVSQPSESLNLTRELTIEAWVKLGKKPLLGSCCNSDQAIVAYGKDFCYILNVYGADRGANEGKVEVGFSNSCIGYSASDSWLNGPTVVDDNKWHYLTFTYDGASKRIYIDGILDASEATTGNIGKTNRTLLIGTGDGISGRFVNGSIDEVRISGKALTAQEINLSFSKGRAYFQNEIMLNSSNYVKGNALQLEFSVMDSSGATNKSNSTFIMVQNTPPNVPSWVYPTNNIFTNFNVLNVSNISDEDGDAITLYFYANGTFNHTSSANSSFDASKEKNYVWNVSAYDGQEFSANNSITFDYDNITPSVSGTSFATTGGITSSPLVFGQVMDWIAATVTDTNLNHVNITLRNGDGTIVFENVAMTNQGSGIWNYTENVSLNAAGNWTVNISAYDNASNRGFQLTNITINTQNVTVQDVVYGYTNGTVLTAGDISALSAYGYDLYEVSDNISNLNNSWVSILTTLNASNPLNVLVSINYKLNINVSVPNDIAKANTNISTYFPELKLSPYSNVVSYISFELTNASKHNDSDKTNALNSLALNATNAFANKFPVYSKNFNNSNLTSAYITYTPMIYMVAGSQQELVQLELTTMRTNKSLNRIYVNLTSTLKTQAKNFQTNVIDQIRGIPNPAASTFSNETIAEIDSNVNDLVVFNTGAAEVMMFVNASNITSFIGKDVWDATQKKLLENNTDGSFDVNISGYSASLIFSEDVDHIQMSSLTSGTVYKASTPSSLSFNYTDGTRDDNYALYGANDARMELFDSHYAAPNFATYYGWLNASYINLSNNIPYSVTIIADKNDQELDKLNYSAATFYGYISVADYANTAAWSNGKNGEVDTWVSLNGSLNIFIDGLDSGASGVNFSSRFKDLVDYARITKGKKAILNTYTAYENFSTWGDGVMKESCINRWNGADAANPDSYSREVWSLELNRSKFFQQHNIPVYCQPFVNRTSLFQIENTTDALNIFYASKVLGYDNFGTPAQPDFNYIESFYAPNVGTDLSKDALTDDNVTYYRRYSNGIVYYNTSNTQGWIVDGRTILNTRLCFDLYDNHANGVTFSFTVNREVTGSEPGDYNISDSELGGVGVWVTKCILLNATEQNLGRWDVQAFVLPRTTIIGQGLNIGNANVGYENRHSWYDSSTSPNSWTLYGMGTNWQINLEVNDTKKASIDTINTITQTEANATVGGKLLQNITLSSGFTVNTEVWSNPTFTNNSQFINLTYLSGGSFVLIYPQNNTDCDSSNPTMNSTIVGGTTVRSCIKPFGDGYKMRVAPNKLSDQTFQANFQSNTAPNIVTWIYPVNNTNTSLNVLNYSGTDPEGDSLTYYIYVNGTFNKTASGNTTLAFSPEKNYWVNVSAYDGSLFSGNSTVYFLFDNVTPNINNASNSNASLANPIYLPVNSVFLNYTFTEPYNATFAVQNRSGNVTVVTADANSFWMTFTGLNDDTYSFIGWINDTASNVNRTANATFTIDTIAPNVSFSLSGSELNNSYLGRTYATYNLTINDSNPRNLTVFLINSGGAVNQSVNVSANASPGWNNISFSGITNGTYTVAAYARDMADNLGYATNFTLIIDQIQPNITIISPLENAQTSQTVTIKYFVNDTSGISSCSVISAIMGNIANGTELNVSNQNQNSITNATSLLEGTQVSFYISCTDLSGNSANSATTTFRIATTLQSPFRGSGATVNYEKTTKTKCEPAKQSYKYGGATYCIDCQGKIAETKGKLFCVKDKKPASQSLTTPSKNIKLRTLPMAAILLLAFVISYVIFATNIIIKWKKGDNSG